MAGRYRNAAAANHSCRYNQASCMARIVCWAGRIHDAHQSIASVHAVFHTACFTRLLCSWLKQMSSSQHSCSFARPEYAAQSFCTMHHKSVDQARSGTLVILRQHVSILTVMLKQARLAGQGLFRTPTAIYARKCNWISLSRCQHVLCRGCDVCCVAG